MKPPTTALLFAGILVLAPALTSCVVPTDGRAGGSTTTVTSYEPGYRTTSLPTGYRSEVISGNTYYYNDGHYYRQQSDGYVVVEAPRTSRYYSDYDSRRYSTTTSRGSRTGGVRVTTLPPGYREVNHRGKHYYQAGDQYYRRQGNGYIVVGRPY